MQRVPMFLCISIKLIGQLAEKPAPVQVMTTMSASELFALSLVDGRKMPPVQVADNAHHECKLYICAS